MRSTSRPRRALRLGLRVKLALIAFALALALPWLGYRYVREVERFLLQSQSQSLIATARAVATALHERPQLLRLAGPNPNDPAASAPPAFPSTTETDIGAFPDDPSIGEAPQPGTGAASAVELGRESEPARDQEREVQAILAGLARSAARIWVVSRKLDIVALAGTLQAAPESQPEKSPLWTRAWSVLVERVLPEPTGDFDDSMDADVLANGPEIESAFSGLARARMRKSTDGRAVIISAAHPIWQGDTVIGAVVAEESTRAVERVRNRALERLLALTLTAVAGTVVALLWFATRLSARVRRLRDEVEHAIDARGRVTRIVAGSSARDEVGDLSRSFSSMLRRLSEHHGYLEGLASRLSHELRTPMAVVRSSLENLRLAASAAETAKYIDRADDGLNRLNKILTRMSEASRMEQSLQAAERTPLDVNALAADCTQGYRLAYPSRTFELVSCMQPVRVLGAADLLAQLLDKLVSNAVDFATPGTPVRIEVDQDSRSAILSVTNSGRPLPETIRDSLFESMVSLRHGRDDDEPHLGLGLYIARQIAEFHGGTIEAADLPSGEGVVFNLRLPTWELPWVS